MSKILHTNDLSFEAEVMSAGLPVLVEFGAQWCGPCQRLLPLLENLADSNSDKIKVVSIDVDESPIAAGKFGVRSVPTLIIFKDGQKIQTKVGLLSQGALEKFVIDSI
jgi:thioredoxin 1